MRVGGMCIGGCGWARQQQRPCAGGACTVGAGDTLTHIHARMVRQRVVVGEFHQELAVKSTADM